MAVLLLVVGLVGAYWHWIVLPVFVTVLIRWMRRSLESDYQGDVARRRVHAELAQRADEQHRLTLAGDPAGTYGIYPPV